MESPEQEFQNGQRSEQNLGAEFGRLQNIAAALREIGFRVIDRFISPDMFADPSSEMGFPIVRDGGDGIRASYSKRDGLRIWFTNGFEDPDNPRRKEAEDRLKELGLM